MNKKILVAYASKYGATAEIAQKIGDTLQASGFDVDILPANQVKEVSQYQSVILGAALYMGQWRKEAVRFLKAHQEALSQQAVWVFTSGPTGEGDPVEQMQGSLMPDGLKAVMNVIGPKEITVFGGKVDDAKMNGFEKWIMKKVKAPSGDFRNWQAITDWTNKVSSFVKASA